MGHEAKNAAWDVEREIEREAPAAAAAASGAAARADFLANLGRRIAELTSMLATLERDPASAKLRDDLRRRLHALGAGARLLRFERLAGEVASAEGLLAAVADRGALHGPDALALRAAFSKLAGLGFTANEPAAPAPVEPPPAPAATWPLSVLVVGTKVTADALIVPAAESAPAIDVERTEDGLRAIDLARAVAPDVIVIDTDRRGSKELLKALRADPLTAAAAIVALGTWSRPEEASAYLALGAARALHKPASPDALRRVCREAGADRDPAAPSTEIGSVSIAELASRLGEEIERAVADGAAANDGARVDLGRGDDVLTAVWSAAARVRDVVTIRSRGEIRFSPGAAERSVIAGSWMHEPAPGGAPARRGGVKLGPAPAKVLTGMKALVADDDPAVAWFLAGVLRAEGAHVTEACDGAAALRKAMETCPDIVLADVLMPHLDGVTLTETLRADPLLGDAAVVLLSWKEDLLQRARELGARADAYLRKDASGPTVVQRVRELLYPKARLAERLAAGGEAHGRADGMTMRTLLTLACAHRPESVVEVRDAAYLYEIEIASGRPANVTRSGKDGTFITGAAALARLLGVKAARFLVGPRRDAARAATLEGSLTDLLRPHAASARGALRILTGAALPAVAKVAFDGEWLSGYGALAPEPARAIVRRLAAGEPPRKLLTGGLSTSRMYEEVVRDAASRGAITAITGHKGEDLLGPQITEELALLLGERPARSVPPEPPVEAPAAEEMSPSGVIVAPAVLMNGAVAPAPALLASATMDDILAQGAPSEQPAPVADSAASVPIDVESAGPSVPVELESAPAAPVQKAPPLVTLGSLTPPPAAPKIEPQPVAAPVIRVSRAPVVVVEDDDESPAPKRTKRRETKPEKTPEAPAVKPAQSRFGVWVFCAVAGVVFAVGARISQERRTKPEAAPAAAVVTAPAVTATESAAPAGAPPAIATAVQSAVTVPGEVETDPILPQEAPLRADEKIPSGQGLLEVVVGPNDEVSIDGRPTVAGPVVKATLGTRDKPYEVRVKLRGEERVRYAVVKDGKRTRVRIAPPWNR